MQQTARPDLYRTIHKALRLGHTRLMVRLGAADWRDTLEAKALLDDLSLHLSLCREHLDHEDAAIHPRLGAVAPQTHAKLEIDHDEHKESFKALKDLITHMQHQTAAERTETGHELYLIFCRFVAADLLHMEREETEVMPVLWHHLDDATLGEIHVEIVSAIAPDRMLGYMRLMLPALNPEERLELMSGLRMGAPEAAFQQVLNEAAKPTLPEQAWRELASGLGIAA